MSKQSKMNSLMASYGSHRDLKITYEEYESISHYYKNTTDPEKEYVVDDITWNDLDLDSVFLQINHTDSCVGRDYLYKLLRTPCMDEEELKKREKLIAYFDGHKKERTECQYQFSNIGFTKKISITDHITRLMELPKASNVFHILNDILIVASILFTVFVQPVLGILLILFAVGSSIVTYYRAKNGISSYFMCIKILVNMLESAHKIGKMNIPELSDFNEGFDRIYRKFASVRHGAWLLTTGNNGSLGDIFMEYFRMITHVDLMKFNSMQGRLKGNEEDIYELIDKLGYLEAMISIASYRRTLPLSCRPSFTENGSFELAVRNVYHTAIKEPVANSIYENGSVLITGSNASGKSTFLKSLAIAAVLAQTVHTVPAESYKAPFYRIYSSMALRDDLDSGESYYIVEIKSLKRILDAAAQDGARILCFIDEVLRGTNTVERIAASSTILRGLAGQKVTCFAATHDIELTELLKDCYANYHFEETFENNEISFNYLLQKGKATSRNAILLLKSIGYDEQLITEAQAMAERFVSEGIWKRN